MRGPRDLASTKFAYSGKKCLFERNSTVVPVPASEQGRLAGAVLFSVLFTVRMIVG